MSDQQIAEAVEAGIATVQRVRRVFVLHGLERALTRKDPDRVYQRKLDAKGEARLIAVTCEKPPDGRDKWTLKLLSEKLIELEVVDSIGIETVRTTLKKRPQTMAEKAVVCSHSHQPRHFCLPDGRSA